MILLAPVLGVPASVSRSRRNLETVARVQSNVPPNHPELLYKSFKPLSFTSICTQLSHRSLYFYTYTYSNPSLSHSFHPILKRLDHLLCHFRRRRRTERTIHRIRKLILNHQIDIRRLNPRPIRLLPSRGNGLNVHVVDRCVKTDSLRVGSWSAAGRSL
jgi:hypothetical protein